jgi:hypothetical protein
MIGLVVCDFAEVLILVPLGIDLCIHALGNDIVPVGAPWTRISSEETFRQARGGDIHLTTLVKVESGLDMCRSARFQTGAVISIIIKEVRSGREQRYECAVKIDPKWPVGAPWVIANTVPVETDLVWISERVVEVIAELQNLDSNEDYQVAIGRARVRCCTFCNWNVRFWLVVCGEWGNGTVLIGELKEPPIRPGTDCVCVVIEIIGAAVSGMGLGNLRMACARATRTSYDDMCHPSTAGLLVSLVAVGNSTETTTVLRATFCYLGNDRVVVGRGALVNRTTIYRHNAGSALCGAALSRVCNMTAQTVPSFSYFAAVKLPWAGSVTSTLLMCARVRPLVLPRPVERPLLWPEQPLRWPERPPRPRPPRSMSDAVPLILRHCLPAAWRLAYACCASACLLKMYADINFCFGIFNTFASCIHAAEHGFYLSRYGITYMSVLSKYSELFPEFCYVFLERKDLFV